MKVFLSSLLLCVVVVASATPSKRQSRSAPVRVFQAGHPVRNLTLTAAGDIPTVTVGDGTLFHFSDSGELVADIADSPAALIQYEAGPSGECAGLLGDLIFAPSQPNDCALPANFFVSSGMLVVTEHPQGSFQLCGDAQTVAFRSYTGFTSDGCQDVRFYFI